MKPETDDELLLNVPSNPFENQLVYVTLHKGDDEASVTMIARVMAASSAVAAWVWQWLGGAP